MYRNTQDELNLLNNAAFLMKNVKDPMKHLIK